MGDRKSVLGVAVWIALRRAHVGGVSNLVGRWLDSGRQVPGYVADALDELISAELLVLGKVDLNSCGVRGVTVTDSGSAQYVALRQVHNPRAWVAVDIPRRRARSPHDQGSHLLAERGPDQIGILVAVCGQVMLWSVDTSAQPTGRQCLTCEALVVGPVPASQFGNPLTPAGRRWSNSPGRSSLPAAGLTPQRR